MAGILPNEGKTLIANLIYKNADANRGTGLELGLFTYSSTIDASITYETIDGTEPTGGTYARKQLTDGSWTVATDTVSYAKQTFQATGSAFIGSVRGYFICSKGPNPKILAIEVDDNNGPYTFLQNDTYDVTPTITIA